jgi:hypothetical protein
MSVVAILLISAVFVLAAMAGLADALVHFACWTFGRMREPEMVREPAQPPAQGITA